MPESRRGFTRRSVLRATASAAGAAGVAGLAGTTLRSTVGAAKPTGERDVLFTSCRVDGTVTLHDEETYERLGTIDVNPDEEEPDDPVKRVAYPFVNEFGGGQNYVQDLDVSPDGRTVYVARGHLGDVVAIDVETGGVEWETELDGFRADHQVITDDGAYLYTSDTLANRVWKVDTATGDRVGSAYVSDFPHGNHLHHLPDGAGAGGPTLVNGSLGNVLAPDAADGHHRLTFCDPDTMAVTRTVDFDEGVRPFAFGPDARTVYVQISYLHGFHEYYLLDDRITRTRVLPQTDAVPDDEDDYPLQSAHHGIALRPDGEYICIAGTTSNAVFVVRRSDLALVDTFRVGKHPYWVQNSSHGERAYVAVKGEDYVSVVDYADAAEVAEIAVDADPMVMETGAVPDEVV